MTTTGYKGHRPDSKAERAHKLIDDNPKMERKDLIARIKKLGVKAAVASHWLWSFRNSWGKKKPAVSKKKVAKRKPKPAAKLDVTAMAERSAT